MLLRHRPPEIDTTPAKLAPGLEHLDHGWVAVLRWLNANRVDFVVVGPVGYAIRGELTARGPVAIVPAPYSRNFDRLSTALIAQNAALRTERGPRSTDRTVAVRLTADKLARGRRWLLRFSGYDLDIEASGTRAVGAAGTAGERTVPTTGDGVRYQELLYEASRFELAPDFSIEVAAPEDLEHFSHVRRTGIAPEFRVMRNEPAAADDPRPPEPSDLSSDS